MLLPKSKGFAGGWLLICFGWGFAVFAGVYVAYKSGGHLNPAVTLGLLAGGIDFAKGIDPTVANMLIYWTAQMIGAFLGAVVAFIAFKQHFDEEARPTPSWGSSAPGRPSARTAGTAPLSSSAPSCLCSGSSSAVRR